LAFIGALGGVFPGTTLNFQACEAFPVAASSEA